MSQVNGAVLSAGTWERTNQQAQGLHFWEYIPRKRKHYVGGTCAPHVHSSRGGMGATEVSRDGRTDSEAAVRPPRNATQP